jgi:VanZ family protein
MEKLFDKAAHAVTYGILSLLLLRTLRLRYRPSRTLLVAVVALTVAYGASDEYHQSFVPGRSASLADLAADGVGAAIAMAAVAGLRRCRRAGRLLPEA